MAVGTVASQIQLRSKEPLYRLLADRLRDSILQGERKLGDQIPTEGELVEEYGVSRATVRQALSLLEHEGYLITKHGSGRFIARPSAIVAAGIEHLKSVTATIAEQGHKPGMRYSRRSWREATAEDAALLEVPEGSRLFAIEREFTADGEVVAFSHDVLPAGLLPSDFTPGEIKGSVFEFLEARCGITVKTAHATVHAMRDPDDAVGKGLVGKDPLFVLLDQTHFSDAGAPVLYSRTYFVEGRFSFTVVRTR